MKIIKQDAFGRRVNSDQLITENINDIYGKLILDLLNTGNLSSSSDFVFALVPDNYKLFVKEDQPDLSKYSAADLVNELTKRFINK